MAKLIVITIPIIHTSIQLNPLFGGAIHCPLWAFKSFFQFWSQRALFHSKRPNTHLPLCSGAPGCPKLMCELVTFEKNLVGASKKFRFYTIKCSKYKKIQAKIANSKYEHHLAPTWGLCGSVRTGLCETSKLFPNIQKQS